MIRSWWALPRALWALLLLVLAGLLLFSQTWAWYGDEGFHLLAAQLINSGRTPYLDFLYPQTPLYAYLNAAWMRLFGETWRASHVLSTLLTGGSILLSASFTLERLPEASWRRGAALLTVVLFGFHFLVIGFGTISQPYGLCLFLTVACFRFVVEAVAQSRTALFLCAGLCAGAAAASSLLVAPVLPILLIWTAWRSAGREWLGRLAWTLAGAGIACLPLAWLAARGPRQTLFNTFEFHFFHRSPGNREALQANLRVWTELLNSAQFLVLILFAAAALLFVAGRSQWPGGPKSELFLCGWLSAGLAAFLTTARPTFPQYFVLLLPFLSILAAVGIMAAASWLHPRLAAGVAVLFVAVLPWWLWEQRRQLHWPQLEDVARKVNQVTPPGRPVWADEALYFAAHLIPPSGLEHSDSHKLKLPEARAASLHVLPRAELYQRAAAGGFETVASCWATDDWIDSSGLRRVYAEHARLHGCDIFWSKVPK